MTMEKQFVYNKGCIYAHDWAVITASNPQVNERIERHHFLLYYLGGEWYHEFFPNVHFQSLLIRYYPVKSFFAMTGDGNVRVTTDDGTHIEQIDTSGDGPSEIQWLLDLREISGVVYACGMGRKVYRRIGNNHWERLDDGIRTDDPMGLRSIDGFSSNELYAAGFHGELWMFDHGCWHRIESPTNVILENVVCAPDGYVYVSGARGVLIRGRADQWEIVQHDMTENTFWSSVIFHGLLYLVTNTSLYCLEDGVLREVDIPLPRPITFGHVATCPGFMLFTGHNDLILTDGSRWEIVRGP